MISVSQSAVIIDINNLNFLLLIKTENKKDRDNNNMSITANTNKNFLFYPLFLSFIFPLGLTFRISSQLRDDQSPAVLKHIRVCEPWNESDVGTLKETLEKKIFSAEEFFLQKLRDQYSKFVVSILFLIIDTFEKENLLQ